MNHEASSARPLTEDQLAVNEYFESLPTGDVDRFRASRPASSLPDNRDVRSSFWEDRDLTPTVSFWMGLTGLNVILVVFAALAPLSMEMMETFVSRPDGFFAMMTFVQVVMFPPIISFSFATVTPMFWYGSVLLRFLVGMLMVVPGCVIFFFLMTLVEGPPPNDFWFAFAGVMFTQFLVAGTVALLVQMWSPWTLTHARSDQGPLPPLGLLAMMELTGIAAIGCAVFMFKGFGDIIMGILFFAAMGAISSLAVIAILIAFLREQGRNRWSAAIAFLACFAMAWLMCGFFAVMEFSWDSLAPNSLFVSATALIGTTVIAAVMWLCVTWLRFCGWRCVNRGLKEEAVSAGTL
jgi:hypothetical protein